MQSTVSNEVYAVSEELEHDLQLAITNYIKKCKNLEISVTQQNACGIVMFNKVYTNFVKTMPPQDIFNAVLINQKRFFTDIADHCAKLGAT